MRKFILKIAADTLLSCFKKGTYFLLSENKIQIVSQKEINNSIFATEDYGMIKEFSQKMIVSQNEKIILKKI